MSNFHVLFPTTSLDRGLCFVYDVPCRAMSCNKSYFRRRKLPGLDRKCPRFLLLTACQVAMLPCVMCECLSDPRRKRHFFFDLRDLWLTIASVWTIDFNSSDIEHISSAFYRMPQAAFLSSKCRVCRPSSVLLSVLPSVLLTFDLPLQF